MDVEIIVPSFGESVSEAVVVKILKPTGSYVKKDEEIMELETDKINAAVTALDSGEVTLTVKLEDRVKIGQKIGTINTAKKQADEPPKPLAAPSPAKEQTVVKPHEPSVEKKQMPGFVVSVEEYMTSLSEPEKAVVKKEVALEPVQISSGGERKKMTSLRKTIAKRLVEVKNQTAMLTTFNEADMTQVMALRAKEQEDFVKKYGVKLGFMSFFVKAVVSGLKAFPQINAYIDGDDIVSFQTMDISVAVSTEKGLMVPVVRGADQMTFADIEKKIAELSAKGRDGKLAIQDLQGGTLTITNGGVFGSMLSTPILNPPQSAILGMHAIQKRPVAIDDQVVIRPMMYLALSYDHRLVDGKEAVGFLVHVKQMIEDPQRFVLDF
jgi:2-oxoglutarate dehydrogenase E2 component (dihydrolipoamide succinyltransferase)